MNHPYADFVHLVEKPARYLGGEYQSIKKDWDAVDVRFVLAFPDVYDIGMSHLGTKILYAHLNKNPRIACERAFAPWPDMEAELRRRQLPVLSLESARPLKDFDHVGCSLQYELSYTNVLTLLDLGGVPLRAADRGEDDPLVWGGGPTATHPEPVALFFDLFLIGDAEEALPRLLLLDAKNKKEKMSRRERLIALAAAGGVYVPSLYAVRLDERAGFLVVDAPLDARVPARVQRAVVLNINDYPFPDDTPVAWAEAVFDRVSVEIARGCTEGCRFCQAGMIYRPVRERDPEQIVDAVVGAIKKGGYDETSLTALSTADVSCITPLVKKIGKRLREEKVSLSVSSLRAYGLNTDLLDEIQSVRATGLTFAPEAGTQRMRDVINKNVTEEDITKSAENVFSRGWSRMKLYFMIGLPTETDEDVRGIAATGGRLKRRGRQLRKDADVTVSVSSHVPKPHTPFQWCAMDSLEEILRKQRMLREAARNERVEYKWHEASVSWLEGIFSRGDRRLADTLEDAWRAGARFDGWDEQLDINIWKKALSDNGVNVQMYLDTIPVDAALPWDHIDVGLEDGFLLREYRRALKDRLSPPCGKPFGKLLHPKTIEEALADQGSGKKLVCYDCGVACDLTQMRDERLVYLRTLDAHDAPPLPVAENVNAIDEAPPVKTPAPRSRKHILPVTTFVQGEGVRYRVRYTKLGRVAFISHLDTSRLLQRLFRRADVPLNYSRGFHPKPELVFGPALGLGIAALAELVDVRVDAPLDATEIAERLRAAAPEGVRIEGCVQLGAQDPGLNRVLSVADYAALLPRGATLRAEPSPITRQHRGIVKTIDIAHYLLEARIAGEAEAGPLRSLLEWPDGDVLRARVRVAGDGSAKASEIVAAMIPDVDPKMVRLARVGLDADGVDLCDLAAVRALKRAALVEPLADSGDEASPSAEQSAVLDAPVAN